jgi:CRP/FNR family transcriptional regulator, dissimilatory nitrate respiration regulator
VNENESIDILKAIRDCGFLNDVDEQLLRSITAISRVVRQPRGTMVFNEGDACRGMYIVHSGAVKLFKTGPDGREHVLHVVMQGDCFGEAAMFLGTGYPADAQAVTDSVLVLVRKEHCLGLLGKEPQLCFHLMGAMAIWSRRLVTKVEALTLKDASARLAGYLLKRSPRSAGGVAAVSDIDLGVPKNVLASQLGISSETLSRLLARFEAQGIISSEGGNVTLLDRRELEEVAQYGAS